MHRAAFVPTQMSKTDIVGECKQYKEERNVLRGDES